MRFKKHFKLTILLLIVFCLTTNLTFGKSVYFLNKKSCFENTNHIYKVFSEPPTGGVSLTTCNTSTFRLNLNTTNGDKLTVVEVQTMLNGDFLIAGNLFSTNGQTEGLIIQLGHSGSIVSENSFKVGNASVLLQGMKVLITGEVVIAGIINDGSNKVFVSDLSNNISTNWVKSFAMSSRPTKMTLSNINNSIALATQTMSYINYSHLDLNGNVLWNKQTSPLGMVDLAGFGKTYSNYLGLIVNCSNNGKTYVRFNQIDSTNGNIISSSLLGDTTEENYILKTTSFSDRIILLGILKDSGNYKLERNITFLTPTIETQHKYLIQNNLDFNSSVAINNLGDVFAVSMPQNNRLFLIKQYTDNRTKTQFTKEYNINIGSWVASIVSSTDGGYLMGVNSKDSLNVLILKTDSIGILSGCSFTDTALFSQELTNVNNIINTTINSNLSTSSQFTYNSFNNVQLISQIDCKQDFCPFVPSIDTCVKTFFKTYRSNTNNNYFENYYLMRNNKHLVTTWITEDLWGTSLQSKYGIKLFDNNGIYINGITYNTNTLDEFSKKIDDSSILRISSYKRTNSNFIKYNIAFISDGLNVLWSKDVQTSYQYYSDGGLKDVVEDDQGNFYLIGKTLGFPPETPTVTIIKLDHWGNQIWLQVYNFLNFSTYDAKITVNNNSIIAIIGTTNGNVSMNVNKTNGLVLNIYNISFKLSNGGGSKLLQSCNDRIYYSGNDPNNKFVISVFDSTGFLIKEVTITNQSSGLSVATFKSNMIYGSYNYFDTITNEEKEGIFKIDTGLNVKMMVETINPNYNWRSPKDIGVNDSGYIFVFGNRLYGGIASNYIGGYIRKYDSSGTIGVCDYNVVSPNKIIINPKQVILPFTYSSDNFIYTNVTLPYYSDTLGLKADQVMCGSNPLCNNIKLSGPDTLCISGKVYNYTFGKSPLCTISPEWIYDTTYLQLANKTDSMYSFIIKNKTGNTQLKIILNNGCKIYEDSLTVLVNKSPGNVLLGPDTSICAGNSILLNAGSGYSNYIWQDQSKDSIYKVILPGQYYVNTIDFCNNHFSDTINVVKATFYFNVGKDTSICKNDSVIIKATAGFNNYVWDPLYNLKTISDSIVFVFPKIDTTYFVTASKWVGCTVSDSIHIHVFQFPDINLGNDTSICKGDSLVLDAGKGFNQYLWNTGASSQTLHVNQIGTYSVSASLRNGCVTNDSIRVLNIIPLPIFSLGRDTTLCENQQLSYNFTLPGASYLWSNGLTSPFITITKQGKYWLRVTQQGCSTNDSINVQYGASPYLKLPLDTTLCDFATLKLNAQQLNGNANYLWQDGSTTPTYTVDKPGAYIVKVKLGNCVGADTCIVKYLYSPPITATVDSIKCVNDIINIDLSFPESNYLWQDLNSTPTYSIVNPGIYYCTVSNYCGSVVDSFKIQNKICECDLQVPNVFSPNGDGVFEYFVPKLNCIPHFYHLVIFDRNGQIVFETYDYNNYWDGKYNKKPVPIGEYYYIIKVKSLSDSQVQMRSGGVTVLR